MGCYWISFTTHKFQITANFRLDKAKDRIFTSPFKKSFPITLNNFTRSKDERWAQPSLYQKRQYGLTPLHWAFIMDISSIYIEAEHWAPGEWNPHNDNSDVIVTMTNGTRWFATFFTYTNITSLVERYKQSGECLSGKYFWAVNMLLVDEVSRSRIEELVHHLIQQSEFEQIFKQVPSEREDQELED